MSIRDFLLSGTALDTIGAFLPFVMPIQPRRALGYQIARSLRGNRADSSYLARTYGGAGTSRRAATLSFWVKRCQFGADQSLFEVNAGSSDTTYTRIYFNSSDKLAILGWSSSWRISTRVFRDPTAWLHIVIAYDWNVTTDNCIRVWVNGVEITAWDTKTNIGSAQDLPWGAAATVTINHNPVTTTGYGHQYWAHIQRSDGQTYSATDFGKFDTLTGAWVPKEFTGSYGSHGFWLSFANDTSTTTLGYDDAGGAAGAGAGSNDFTLTNFELGSTTGFLGSGDRTSLITVTSSMTPVGGTLSNLVDGATTSNSTDSVDFTGATITSGTTYIKFDMGRKTRVYRFRSTTVGNPTCDWKWQGSNDDSTWTDVTASATWTDDQTWACTVQANYRYYRIIATSSGTHGNIWTNEITFDVPFVGTDSLVDTPTNYGTDAGAGGEVGGNYATLSALQGSTGGTLSNGNLRHAGSSGAHMALSTWQMSSGKHYCEVVITTGTSTYPCFGIYRGSTVFSGSYLGGVQWSIGMFVDRAIYRNAGIVTTPSGTSFSTGDIMMIFFDADAGTLYFGRNGTWLGSANPNAATGAHVTGLTERDWHFASGAGTGTIEVNFGQRPFAYTPPTGVLVQCTQNRDVPAIPNPRKFFDIDTFAGTSATRSKTGMLFQPDFAWFKNRSTTTDHAIYDSTRGVQKRLETNNTDDEVTGDSTGLTAFNSDGYTTGALAQINNTGHNFVAWLLKNSPTCGFDIVTYTGNGSNRTIAHDLGVAPKMIIVKALSTASTNQGWAVYHEGVASDPQTDYLLMNSTGAVADDNTYWNDTLPTSSVFSLGTNAAVNANGDTYVAYLFTDVSGFCKVGNYSGNASADGPYVWCGFKPRFLLVKSTASANNWMLVDSDRRVYNPTHIELYPDSTSADNTSNTRYLDFLSNGFKIRNTETLYNGSSVRIVFLAFAAEPFKYARAA